MGILFMSFQRCQNSLNWKARAHTNEFHKPPFVINNVSVEREFYVILGKSQRSRSSFSIIESKKEISTSHHASRGEKRLPYWCCPRALSLFEKTNRLDRDINVTQNRRWIYTKSESTISAQQLINETNWIFCFLGKAAINWIRRSK